MMSKKQVTIVVDGEVYDALRKAISPKKISYEIEDLMEKRLAELKGTEYRQEEQVDYEALKREHDRLVKEVDRQEKWLRKRKAYENLARLAVKVGLTPDLSRLDEVAPKLRREWTGSPQDAHLFISLLEAVRARRELERKLDEIRDARAASRQAPV
jgi:hypothetical protein